MLRLSTFNQVPCTWKILTYTFNYSTSISNPRQKTEEVRGILIIQLAATCLPFCKLGNLRKESKNKSDVKTANYL
jgi:hypothetical protein